MKIRKLLLGICLIFTVGISILPTMTFASNESELSLYSPTYVLMEKNTGKIIHQKDMNKRMYPASTTKLMTAILAMEHCKLDDVATVSYDAVFTVPSGYTNAALQVDEKLTIENLLYVLLLPSANDAANVLAEHIAGSVESFATMMNTKAIELGCTGTNFVNPSGIHDENHYSTAHDLALIGQYAMKFDTLMNIINTKDYTLPTTEKYDKTDRQFFTTNNLLKPGYKRYYYEYATGLKTGYTKPAEDCIVASAKKDNLEFIAVVLGCPILDNGVHQKYLDCKTLFDYGFTHYTTKNLITQGSVCQQVQVHKATSDTKMLDLVAQDDVTAFVANTTSEEPQVEVNYIKELKAPIYKDEVIGTATYTIDGLTYQTNLKAASDVERSTVIRTIFTILCIFLILFFLSTLLGLRKPKKRKRKSKKLYR